MEKIAIIGSGPAGYTAAIYASRALLQPILITGSLPGGQLTQTTDIENYPAYPDAISGFELMEAFKKQAEKFGTRIVFDNVESVELKNGGPHKLLLANGEEIITKALIIATGASPKWLGLESEKRFMAKGVSACATCDGAFFKGQNVVVVGGGDTAMEEAIFLTRFASKVYVVHRRDKLRASKIMAERAMKNPKIEFIWNSVVIDIFGENQVEGVIVKNVLSNQVSEIKVNGYFAALGHTPNTSIFKGMLEMDEYGYIITKEPGTRTNINGVFAAGDCADKIFRQAITAAGMGCKAAIEAERWLEN
ncbi:MAG TPA: thioredoxin-disulfide reductase [Victivallales bacterium]|nr:thioredoxin-disulfide reductase [Victivallales bacterium]HRR06790.1 thioredoxin-disulfide reductase [Victivallales bacterium]HRR29232.1 thioredoxin-disulfide reductase [Victivallales bacterium]HRU01616.1 thioredoxin-disulfide reductase [Victivallales bacterium]